MGVLFNDFFKLGYDCWLVEPFGSWELLDDVISLDMIVVGFCLVVFFFKKVPGMTPSVMQFLLGKNGGNTKKNNNNRHFFVTGIL